MEKNDRSLTSLIRIITYAVICTVPIFFLPLTQEFFSTNKLYFLAFSSLLLLAVTAIKILVTKSFSWHRNSLDNAVVLFLIASGLSVIFSSPNKVAALLSPNFGFILFLALTVLYFYFSRIPLEKEKDGHPRLLKLLNISAIIVALSAVIFYFQPFKNANLPSYLQSLKNPTFNTVGAEIDLMVFLGFIVIWNIGTLLKKNSRTNSNIIMPATAAGASLIGLALMVYTVVVPLFTNQQSVLAAAPYRLSWYAAVETLKQPLTALFGVGIFNFSSIFTLVKDGTYNTTPLWQVSTFNFSRSTLLHVFTETGLIGALSFLLLLYFLISRAFFDKKTSQHIPMVEKILVGYLALAILLLPPSLILFFLFFFTVAQLSRRFFADENGLFHHAHVSHVNLGAILPAYLLVLLISFGAIGAGAYLLGRTYIAEYYFRRAFDGYTNNSAAEVYNNQRTAITYNPYIERFRISFAQTNLLIANNLAQRIQEQAKNTEKPQVNEQDRQTIAQAIQAAIQESKAAVALNPQRASNWENLANIYRNVLNIAQGADVWTISSYQRAIILDPRNPVYRLNLGGVYFSMGNYDEASKLFEQTVALKPDWSNAYYNLAWAAYQKKDFQTAAAAMQNVIKLLDPVKDEADLKKAQSNLDEFKAKIPKAPAQEPEESASTSGNLKLPTPQPTISPKIELPEDASPPSPPPGTETPAEGTSEGAINGGP